METLSSSQPKRVAWIIKGLGLGGAERIVADLAPLFPTEEFSISVISTRTEDALETELIDSGLSVEMTPSNGRWPFFLLQSLLAGKYDVVHTHSPLPAILVSVLHPLLKRTSRWPDHFVDTAHTDVASYHPATRRLTVLTARFRDRVMATSEIARLGVAGESVVHHGVPPAPEFHDWNPDPNRPHKLVSVAGLRPQKDHATLLEACALLRDQGLTFHLDLIGDGPLRIDLEKQSAILGLSSVVTFHGWRTDVRDILHRYDTAVLATHYEGFPIAIVEAIEAGLSIVASDVPGSREALTLENGDVCGSLVPLHDAEAMAEAIHGVMSEFQPKHRAESLKTRAQELSIDLTIEKYSETYRSLTKTR